MKTKPTEPDLIEEVEELLAKATPGPWSRSPAEPSIVQTAFAVVCDTAFGVNPPAWRIDNAELIAAAPELLHRLVEEVKRLRNLAEEFAFEEGDDFDGRVDAMRTFHGKDSR